MAHNFRLAPGEVFEMCPYNQSHQVTNKKFLMHLNKCREEYKRQMAAKGKNVEMVQCRFNWSHHMTKIEQISHESRCPNRYSIVPFLAHQQHEMPKVLAEEAAAKAAAEAAQAADISKKSKSRRHQQQQTPADEEENWDETSSPTDYTPGYNPQEKLKSGCYLYNPMGYSRSQRKNFRYENRQRFQKDALEKELGIHPARPHSSGDLKTEDGRYIPGLNYSQIKKEKDDQEWETATVGCPTPKREVNDTEEEGFSLSRVKKEKEDNEDAWETATLERSPARLQDVKDEPNVKEEPVSYDWDEDS